MSNEFVISQMEYYKKQLNSGPSRDWNLISGLHQRYRSIAISRGLITA